MESPRLQPFNLSTPPGLARQLGRVRAVRARPVAAETGSRKDLPRVEPVFRVEGAPHSPHRVQILFGEHLRHVRSLVPADAMLAGDRASRTDADAQDLA